MAEASKATWYGHRANLEDLGRARSALRGNLVLLWRKLCPHIAYKMLIANIGGMGSVLHDQSLNIMIQIQDRGQRSVVSEDVVDFVAALAV